MSSTPPEQQRTTPGLGGYGRSGSDIGAILPIPGNAELLVYVLATIVVAIIAAASDSVGSRAFVTSFTVMTLAYLISRGIAKASRVLEQ